MLKRFITNFPIKKFMEYYQSICGYFVQRGNPITNQQGIQYFTCWSEHMKYSDKPLLKETMRKTAAFIRNFQNQSLW